MAKVEAMLTREATATVTLFTFVKCGDGYEKRYITLSDLIARLSDKPRAAQSIRKGKYHSHE